VKPRPAHRTLVDVLVDAGHPLRFVDLPGGTFAYFEQGEAGAPLVVLAHGFPDYPKTFFPLMERIVAAGYRCVAPFLRGYAPSTLHGPFDRFRIADDLADLAAALSPVPAVLVGHDWGAVATYSALRREPARFRRAVTLAVPHVVAFARNLRSSRAQLDRSRYMAFFMLPLLADRIVPRGDFAYIDALWRRWSPGYEPSNAYRRELKSCLAASLPAPLEHYRALRPSRAAFARLRADARERIRVPLLYLHGEDDGCIGPEMDAGQERYFDGEFRSEHIPGAGHFLHLENPDRVASSILAFIGAGAP
jgi:pimeloyl-ACP methyl ester carboxylesterase